MSNYFFLLICFAHLAAFSQKLPSESQVPIPAKSTVAAPLATVNVVLFSEGDQSWTLRDFRLYKKLVGHLTRQEKLSVLADTMEYDFMMSRLLKREALLFEIRPEAYEFTAAAHPDLTEYSKSEISEEVETIVLASSLLKLKEKQMGQKARFKAWIDVLKRKYAVKVKANEFIN